MNDKQLEALVNHLALEAGAGLCVGTLYGDMALAVAKEVRERCASMAENHDLGTMEGHAIAAGIRVA